MAVLLDCVAAAALLLGCFAATPALAANVIDAKLRCQMEYGSGSDTDVACERGVDLGSRAGDDVEDAINECSRDTRDATHAAACQHGVTLRARAADGRATGNENTSSFSYSWKEGRPAAQVEIGDFEARIGDAEKSTEACLRAFEGSSTPPSCMAGITVQRKPPAPPPLGSVPP